MGKTPVKTATAEVADENLDVIAAQAEEIEELKKRLTVVESEYEAACTELRGLNEKIYADRKAAERAVTNQEPKTAAPKSKEVAVTTPSGKPIKIGVDTK